MNFRDEAPTLALICAVYGAFAVLTLSAEVLPLTLVIPALAIVLALFSSLQHEVLHGHPFKNQALSDATVFPALALFIPYLRFKDTHLAHHHDPNLTDPYDDPETNYFDVVKWDAMPASLKQLTRFNNTLLGRMLVGPVMSLAIFYTADLRAMLRGDRRVQVSYVLHGLGLMISLGWVLLVTPLPLWAYLLAGFLGMSLLKIRTFLEHQAHDRASARSVIIEDRGPLALLFLNNNYHAVHHAHPGVVWHKLPALFASRRELFLKRNGGYTYRSYKDVFRQYFLRAKDPVAHPIWTLSNRTRPPGGAG